MSVAPASALPTDRFRSSLLAFTYFRFGNDIACVVLFFLLEFRFPLTLVFSWYFFCSFFSAAAAAAA